jgi:hypothetical protein
VLDAGPQCEVLGGGAFRGTAWVIRSLGHCLQKGTVQVSQSEFALQRALGVKEQA